MFALVVMVLAGMPAAYELDYGALPPANTVPFCDFTIIFSYKGEPDVKVPIRTDGRRSPEEAASDFFESLDDPRWKVKKDGNRIIFYGYWDVRIRGLKVVEVVDVPIQTLTVEGNGPQPVVRRVPYLPPAKKK